jgi:hypothetical protein
MADAYATNTQAMARGRRTKTSDTGIPLSDSGGRTRLARARPPRELLRRRYRALVAKNEALQGSVWFQDANDIVEVDVVDQLELAEIEATLRALEHLNERQQFAMLRRRWECINGEPALSIEHLCEDGSTILRVATAAECEHVCLELYAPDPWPDPAKEHIYAVCRPEGTYGGLLVGQLAAHAESQSPHFFLHSAIGVLPAWDDRDPMWSGPLDAVARRDGNERPVKEWFAYLRENGTEVGWAKGERWLVRSCEELIAFYDRLRWSPRRFRDGFDERFGIAGPRSEVDLQIAVAECVAWVTHDGLVWEIDAAEVADALCAAVALVGGSIGDVVVQATAVARAYTPQTQGAYGADERREQLARFVGRLRQLAEVLGSEAQPVADNLDPGLWPEPKGESL